MRKLFVFLFVCSSVNLMAQKIDSLAMDTLRDAEIRMAGMGEIMINSYDEEQRLINAKSFLITMGRALRIKNSYYYRFDSLKCASVLYSPDEKFRIITWNIALNNETFHYYGVIQLNPEHMKKIKDTTNLRPFYPLIDRSTQIKKQMDTITGPEFWWGANYYTIVPVVFKKKTYYTLLGWNKGNIMLNKKVVEILSFENNKPVLGAPVFDLKDPRFTKPASRMVFEFSNSGAMILRYEPKKKYLIYENMVPPRQQDYGHPETYLSDGSFEYMIFNTKTGLWEKQKGPLKDFNLE